MNSILVIEDQALIRKSICEILRLKGYETESESNGEAGLQRAIKMKPDLVLCDIIMPKVSGLQMLKSLRKTPGLEHIPFIFITALSAMPDVRQGMNLGADDYLTKPFDHKELLAIVAQQLMKTKIRSQRYLKEGELKIKEVMTSIKDKAKENVRGLYQSLERAKTIQNVILPKDSKMTKYFPNHFVYYEPKDTISGDFYWIRKVNNITLIAVADCTGHGVPGALMTMVCYSKLNIAVDQFQLSSPAEILIKVNELVVEFMNLNQANHSGDGMDISLCAIDNKKRRIKFAGAKQSIYLITNKVKESVSDNNSTQTYKNGKQYTLFKLRGSNCSIGSIEPRIGIQEQTFKYEENDTLYLCSDGYADQFGGDSNTKFKSKNLVDLLLSIQDKDIKGQGQVLKESLQIWKGNEEQTDDITTIGLKL